MNLSESVEMYLETIYFIQENHGHAHVIDIANMMNVSKASVSKTMNQLKEEGLVNKETYGHITLTDKGETISREIVKKHYSISRFLEKSLKLNPSEAAKNACKMEHIISDEMIKAIEMYLEEIDQLAGK
ncbi:metal-dependent transcriptional regulator [Alkalibacter mobilis]|uniref:metal-dependent transcriptional regulator n=1 Tax=Alkalibacter mobilis TaxID=2787712 RepID=UPI00189FE384|nr:metal-dependent transcriptional regulator [Alkalibacter mobilis]MBF7096807.1 metal-dependent transcriptional regulator [Alkalibacter mobilis]